MPDHKLIVTMSVSTYDAVLMERKGKYDQAMHDLPSTAKDARVMINAVKRYGITDNGDGSFTLEDN